MWATQAAAWGCTKLSKKLSKSRCNGFTNMDYKTCFLSHIEDLTLVKYFSLIHVLQAMLIAARNNLK